MLGVYNIPTHADPYRFGPPGRSFLFCARLLFPGLGFFLFFFCPRLCGFNSSFPLLDLLLFELLLLLLHSLELLLETSKQQQQSQLQSVGVQ